MSKKVFIVDVAKCSGCYNCQFACKDEHCGNDWTPYAKEQPLIGQFWNRLEEKPMGSQPKLKILYLPHFCNHCDNPACLAACEADAIYKREDGLVIIDPEKCNGCKKCMEACPYDMIYFNEKLFIAQKCTGCAHLLDEGKRKVPRCVDVCASDALMFGDEEDFAREIRGAELLKPEEGTHPNVYYRNIPGQFIAGTVYDPEKEEVIKNARCHLSVGPRTWDVYTDVFGDFWFKDLPVGYYDLYIEAEGYERLNFTDIDTGECVNLGDIAMKKAEA